MSATHRIITNSPREVPILSKYLVVAASKMPQIGIFTRSESHFDSIGTSLGRLFIHPSATLAN